MKIRLITGTCYVLTLASFFALKTLVHDLCFDALTYLFALIGTFEMLRAMGTRVTRAQKGLTFAFAVCCIPLCALFEQFSWWGANGVIAAAKKLKRVTMVTFDITLTELAEKGSKYENIKSFRDDLYRATGYWLETASEDTVPEGKKMLSVKLTENAFEYAHSTIRFPSEST